VETVAFVLGKSGALVESRVEEIEIQRIAAFRAWVIEQFAKAF